MIQLIGDGTISSKLAKKVFLLLAEEGGTARQVVEKHGMIQLSDPSQLLPIIQDVLANNAQSIEDFKNGKDRCSRLLSGSNYETNKRKSKSWSCKPIVTRRISKILINERIWM